MLSCSSYGLHKACQTGENGTSDLGDQNVPELEVSAGDKGTDPGARSEAPASETKVDVSTEISDLDALFFTEEAWESLALDVGYRLVLVSGIWEESEKEER